MVLEDELSSTMFLCSAGLGLHVTLESSTRTQLAKFTVQWLKFELCMKDIESVLHAIIVVRHALTATGQCSEPAGSLQWWQ